jgi:hypothetical protein
MTVIVELKRRFISRYISVCVAAFVCVAASVPYAGAQQKARARDLGIPHECLREIMRKYNRLLASPSTNAK